VGGAWCLVLSTPEDGGSVPILILQEHAGHAMLPEQPKLIAGSALAYLPRRAFLLQAGQDAAIVQVDPCAG
jgi:hypothetical protein